VSPDGDPGDARRRGFRAYPCPSARDLPAFRLLRAVQALTARLLLSLGLISTPLGAAGGPSANASPNSIEVTEPQSGPVKRPLNQPQMDRQIERILENPEFSWREPYSETHRAKKKSLIGRFLSWIRESFLSIGNALNRLWESLRKIFDFKRYFAEPPTSESNLSSGISNLLTYLLWATLAGTIILFAFRLRKPKKNVPPRTVLPPPIPDLADEGIEANQLSDGQWSALARQKIAAGEFRQALRALFLAVLALLASQRFIAIDRWKSNSDYEKELSRKAKPRSDLLALFSQSRHGFERCWYGADRVTSDDVENYSDLYERIKHAATDDR
jgi:hypothetical protein